METAQLKCAQPRRAQQQNDSPAVAHKQSVRQGAAPAAALAALMVATVMMLPDAHGPSGPAVVIEPPAVAALVATPDPRQQALASHLSRRYKIAADLTERVVGAAHRAAEQVGLDPLLLVAVVAIESRFNPFAESVMGAKGLMQIIPKYHRQVVARHGGERAMLEPDVNVLVGAHILKDYIRRAGNIEAGLQFYNGSPWDETTEYAEKVIAERDRLRQALRPARRGESQRI